MFGRQKILPYKFSDFVPEQIRMKKKTKNSTFSSLDAGHDPDFFITKRNLTKLFYIFKKST